MNSKIKKVIIAVIGVLILLVLVHLTMNALIPAISQMHQGMY